MDISSRPSAPTPKFVCRALPGENFLLPNVHIYDPQNEIDVVGDLLVEEGKIAAFGSFGERPPGLEVLNRYEGCWVFPGFVDPHVHLRTPGFEYKEDLASGSRAAAAGGYVALLAMANTEPVIDNGPLAAWIFAQAASDAVVRIGQVGAVSKNLAGEELTEMYELAEAGVAAFSDDGKPLDSAGLLLQALRYAKGTGRPLLLHLEDRSLSADGVMHEGKWSAKLGLCGIPSVAESGPMARDLELVHYMQAENERLATVCAKSGLTADALFTTSATSALTENVPPVSASLPASPNTAATDVINRIVPAVTETPLIHFQHLSTAESVALLRKAKTEGLLVTAEVTPEHLLFTDERLTSFNANYKINPPLRSEEDRTALVEALAEGIIDCIATDHAPHALHEKEVPIEEAPSGSITLEVAFAALYTGLVKTGQLSLDRLIKVLSAGPCKVMGIAKPSLEVGEVANFCVVHLEETWAVTLSDLQSKSCNCAFLGETLTSRVGLTVVDGVRRFARNRDSA